MKKLKKYNRENCRKMADRLMRQAERTHKKEIKLWNEPDMVQMVKDDLKDKKKIASCLRKGHISEAYTLADDLDTTPREDIPQSVWEWLMDWRETQ